MRDGETIADVMREAGWTPGMTNARVSIDGRMVDSARWEYIVPARGSSVVVRRIPMGSGSGGGGKQIGMMIGLIAVMALAWYAAPALFMAGGAMLGMGQAATVAMMGGWGTVLSAGIGISGMLAMRALIPAP
jgi:hypothetical protein